MASLSTGGAATQPAPSYERSGADSDADDCCTSDEPAFAPPAAVKGPFLLLQPPAAEAAWRHRQYLQGGRHNDGVFLSVTLALHALRAYSSSGTVGRTGAAAYLSVTIAAALLAALLFTPRLYASNRPAAVLGMAAIVLLGDVTWLRDTAAHAGGGGGFVTSAATSHAAAAGAAAAAAGGECAAAVGGVAGAAVDGTWGSLADALLVKSGVSVLLLHSIMLSLDFQGRVALAICETALFMVNTTVPVARTLAAPVHLPLLTHLHTAAHAAALRALAALTALPLPLPAVLPAAAPPPACLPLAAVFTAQIMLGFLLPLWIAFLLERRARTSFALTLCHRAVHDAAAAAAAIAPRKPAPPARLCRCGDPLCSAGEPPPPCYSVRGVPTPMVQLLYLSAHAACFAMSACAMFTAAALAPALLVPGDALQSLGVCPGLNW